MKGKKPTKLSKEQIAEIVRREKAGERVYRLADEYKVNINRIKLIVLTGADNAES